MGKLEGMLSVFYERYPNRYLLLKTMVKHKLKFTKWVDGGVE